MEIETWPVNKPVPYAGNARKIPEAAVAKVAASIGEYGWRQPIVVDEQGVIVAGHTRLLAARRLGLGDVPVHVARGLTAAQVKAYRLMDNRSHEEAKWDVELLPIELADLKAIEFDLSLTGFDDAELERLLGPEAGLTDADAVPAVPELATTQPGDSWLLGPHRLLCGDATSEGDVRRLLGGAKPFLMVTDPPYGVELDMEWRDRAGHNEMGPASKSYMKQAMAGKGISGDTRADWSEAFELVPSIEVAYVWHATSHLVEVAVGLDRIGFQIRQQIIWHKTVAAMSRQAYHWKHEPCWYAVRKGKTARWIGSRDQSTIWDAASPKHIMSGSKEEKLPHPTQKPVELMYRPISNHGATGDLIYEPFCGSGTTLIAAEMARRVSYNIEVEPRYCDVIVQRWQNFTGKEATLEGDGRIFAEIKSERFGIRLGAQDAIAEEVLRS